MSDYYVYFLIDSRTELPFYVGKGRGKRSSQHLREAAKPGHAWSNAIKCRRILAIQRSGGQVIIQHVHSNLSNSEALTIESLYIKQYGRLVDNTGTLTNVITEDQVRPTAYISVDQYTLSGEYVCTYSSVQEAAAAAGVAVNTMSGVINNRCHRGKHMRTAGGFRWVHSGHKLPTYDRYKASYAPKQRPICQYTLQGEIIKTYGSATEACNELGLDPGRISVCCNRGRIKTVGGFCWAFEGSEPRLPNLRSKRYSDYLHQSGLAPDPV